MFIKIPTLINFNIENTYKEFAKIFDNKESNIRHFKLNFKPFLGFRRAYPDKVISYIRRQREIFESLFNQIVNR